MLKKIKPSKLFSISGYLLGLFGLAVSQSALAQNQSIFYGSEQQFTFLRVENFVGENRDLIFRRMRDQTWVSYKYKPNPNLPARAVFYETVFERGNEIRLLNQQCNIHVSLYLHIQNPTNLAGKVTYFEPNQPPKLLGDVKAQFVGSVVFDPTLQHLENNRNTLPVQCPHLLRADEEISSTIPAKTNCSPLDWMGVPWQTSYGPMVPVVVPDPNSPGTHQFHANYGNNNTLKGKIRKDSPCEVYGEWSYPNGTRGEFLFNLLNKNNFTGVWTNQGVDPVGKPVNWTGSR